MLSSGTPAQQKGLALLTVNSTRHDLPCTNMEGRQYDRQLCVNFIDRLLCGTHIPSRP